LRRSLLVGLVACFAALPLFSRAASISVTGANGANAAPEPDAVGVLPAADPGGPGGPATALADGADPSNTASAIGGTGGNGGTGGDSTGYDPVYHLSGGGSGGTGGAGGAALATATANNPSGPASTQATSQGGAGGYGGLGGSGSDWNGSVGMGGPGGDAESLASATASAGSASATALATGAQGGVSSGPEIVIGLQDPVLPTVNGGRGGAALADANAVSDTGNADALARAFGGTAGAGGGANTNGWGNGGMATAHANAETSGAGTATATAEATAGGPPDAYAVTPASADASAHAVSLLGDATAIARQTGGHASASVEGGLVASAPVYGGPGGNSVMVDKVSGAAGGRLTLSQEATAGAGSSNGGGGLASSDLHATNPLGGELVARVTAQGGAGGGSTYPAFVHSQGGSATATVTATDTAGKYVEADATALGGSAGYTYLGYDGGGNALAHATATGLGPTALARADATAMLSAPSAASDALVSGPIAGAHAGLGVSGSAYDFSVPYEQMLQTQASVGLGTTATGAALPQTGVKQAFIAAAPTAADVASWTAGNPNAQAAVTDWEVVALGSLASNSRGDGSHLTGTLQLDLTAATYGGPSKLALAFLDPSAMGTNLDLLHLAFAVDGSPVFETSFTDSASAGAGLDDVVIDLGTLGASSESIRDLVLSFELDFPNSPTDGAFALDLALLAQAAVPEPSTALLVCAGAVLFALRRASRLR